MSCFVEILCKLMRVEVPTYPLHPSCNLTIATHHPLTAKLGVYHIGQLFYVQIRTTLKIDREPHDTTDLLLPSPSCLKETSAIVNIHVQDPKDCSSPYLTPTPFPYLAHPL